MIQFGKLPLLVNEKILGYVLDDTGVNIIKKLALLGVCHDWREISMPLLYRTLFLAEPSTYYPENLDSWRLPGPSGRDWRANIAPFNIHDVFCHAKKLEIGVYTYSGLEHLYDMLKHIFSLGSSRPSAIDELHFWISDFLISDSNSVYRHFQHIADFLAGIIPSVASISLHAYGLSASFASYFTRILNGYAGPSLKMLKSTGLIDVSHSTNLRHLTVLDLGLCENNHCILSLLEPQILRKVSLRECYSTYLWKYFAPLEHDGKRLEFTSLTDLCIKSNYYFEDADDPELDGTFAYEHSLLAKNWADDIASRNIAFPSLDKIHFENCHFADLFFANCEFPKNIAKAFIYHDMSRTFSCCEWILGNIPTSYISVETHPDQQDDTRESSNEFIVSQFGSKIVNLQIEELSAFDPARINLPMLYTLCIDSIYFLEMLSLISKLPRLYELTLGCLQMNNSAGSEHPDNPYFMVTPVCPSLAKTTVRTLPRFYLKEANACMVHLLNCLTGLRLFCINAKQGSSLASYVADNVDKYPHFNNLDVLLLDIPMRY